MRDYLPARCAKLGNADMITLIMNDNPHLNDLSDDGRSQLEKICKIIINNKDTFSKCLAPQPLWIKNFNDTVHAAFMKQKVGWRCTVSSNVQCHRTLKLFAELCTDLNSDWEIYFITFFLLWIFIHNLDSSFHVSFILKLIVAISWSLFLKKYLLDIW